MNKFFCSSACREADEDIIGSGTNYSVYVLIECPYPWKHNAFESRFLPKNLEMLMARGMLIEAKKKRGEIDYYGVHL